MSFLNNFKYQYHIKYLENLLGSKDYPGMFNYLINLKSNKKLFHDLSLKYINDAINKSEQDISKCKIVWISSYLNEDYGYIASFIESYLSNFRLLNQKINSYQNEINNKRVTPPLSQNVIGIIKLDKTPDKRFEYYSSTHIYQNTRDYFGPVDIDRLKIKLVDDRGEIVDLRGLDWNFTLSIEQLYQY